MGEMAIRVENLGKKYEILHKHGNASDSLIDAFTGGIARLFRRHELQSREAFWALRDISFEVARGDRVGIIGRNGAGKSTLLKILSRIVHPTTGRLVYEGRMASLLEVGTGFHGDLTGRENIYLNGSILGMSRQEITARFDEIVAFSEVEQFLDTPVKKYSSGMYVRLAFAVAAHLEPEILVVDEVLAVGDAAFQKKCLGKISEISDRQGKTVLFVSHNMQSVQKICNRGLMLAGGQLSCYDSIDRVIAAYMQSASQAMGSYEIPEERRNQKAYAYKVTIENQNGEALSEIPVGGGFRVRAKFRVLVPVGHFVFGLGIVTSTDLPVRTSWSRPQDIGPGEYEIVFDHGDLHLTTGTYRLIVGLSESGRTFQYVDDGITATVSEAGDAAYDDRIVNTQSGLILNPMNVTISRLD